MIGIQYIEILPGPKCSKTEIEGTVCSSPISAAIGMAMDQDNSY